MAAIVGWKRGVARQLHPRGGPNIIKGNVYACRNNKEGREEEVMCINETEKKRW